MKLYLDIETLPGECSEKEAEIRAAAELEVACVKAPSNYKDAAKIAEFCANKQTEILGGIDAAIAEARKKTSFDGLYGSIACICYAFDNGEIFSVDTITSGSETTMLEHFYSHVYDAASVLHHSGVAEIPLSVVGHNIAGFDLPFLKHRSILLGVKPPLQLLKAMNAKPWDACIEDTMLMWSADREKRVSMDKLCRAFGIDGKGDMDGSQVAEVWKTNPDKVIEYCMGDVERTRAIYKRLTFQG